MEARHQHIAQRELPPLEADLLTLSSIDDVSDLYSETSLTTTYDDTASLVTVKSDGEHGRKILRPAEGTTMYDPDPISLYSTCSDLSEGFHLGQTDTETEDISTPLTSIEEDGLIFNEMH